MNGPSREVSAPDWTTAATLRVTDLDAPTRVGFAIESILNARETCTFAVTTANGAPATELTFATEVPSIRGPLAPLVDRLFVVPNLKKQTLRELELMKGCLETR